MDHQPLSTRSLEHVRCEERRHRNPIARAREDVLRADDPRQVGVHVHVDVGDAEAHLTAALEDGVPRLADSFPPGQERPAGVDAANVVGVRPDLIHLGDLEAFEGPVETRVGLLDLGGVVGCHELRPPRAPSTKLVSAGQRADPAMLRSMSMLAVDERDLVKTFGSGWFRRRRTEALRGASLQVPRGAIFGLLGPNGAGKTTLLSILATLLLPDGGSAKVLGHDVVSDALAIRRRLNMASGNASFVWSLRPAEVLNFYGRLYGLRGTMLKRRVDELIERCELGPHRKTEYNELSTGLKQRLAFAKALLNEPEVLFLDEPTLGLDPDVSVRIRAQIAELRKERGTTIILTTHYMREAEELCDTIAFIKAGRILAQGTADELKRQIRMGEVIALRLDPAVPEGLARLPGILQPAARGDRAECTVDDAEKRLPEILRWLHEQGVLVRDCQVKEPELEEVFVELAR